MVALRVSSDFFIFYMHNILCTLCSFWQLFSPILVPVVWPIQLVLMVVPTGTMFVVMCLFRCCDVFFPSYYIIFTRTYREIWARHVKLHNKMILFDNKYCYHTWLKVGRFGFLYFLYALFFMCAVQFLTVSSYFLRLLLLVWPIQPVLMVPTGTNVCCDVSFTLLWHVFLSAVLCP